MIDLKKMIKERTSTHGDYTAGARVMQTLKDVMMKEPGWQKLFPCQRESLHMFAHKIGRILVGDPNLKDHWDDIAGYAKLAGDSCGL